MSPPSEISRFGVGSAQGNFFDWSRSLFTHFPSAIRVKECIEQVSLMFQFRSLLLAGLAAGASGQAVAPEGGCLICGEGQVVTQPDAIFEFAGQ